MGKCMVLPSNSFHSVQFWKCYALRDLQNSEQINGVHRCVGARALLFQISEHHHHCVMEKQCCPIDVLHQNNRIRLLLVMVFIELHANGNIGTRFNRFFPFIVCILIQSQMYRLLDQSILLGSFLEGRQWQYSVSNIQQRLRESIWLRQRAYSGIILYIQFIGIFSAGLKEIYTFRMYILYIANDCV